MTEHQATPEPAPARSPAADPVEALASPSATSEAHGPLAAFLRRGLNALVFAVLALLFIGGHHVGWKLPRASELFHRATAEQEDWCSEHFVPESQCVECNEELLPRQRDFGYCDKHGVEQCVIDHPELAQLAGAPHLPQYDTVRAIGLLARPANPREEGHHAQRVQVASLEAAAKAGINVAPVEERRMRDTISANGEVTFDPTRVAHLSPRVAGTVTAVFKSTNDPVEAGETLALVDAAQVGQAKAQLLDALVKLQLKRTTYSRFKDHAGALPAMTVTEAEAALQEAEVAFVSARQGLVNLGFELPERIETLRAAEVAEQIRFLGIPADFVSRLPAGTKTANLIPLRTPYAGVIISSDVVAGEVVDSNKLLFTVADPRALWLHLSVREEDAHSISLGQPVEFRTEDGTQAVRGTVSRVSPAIDERTRALKVYVTLSDGQQNLQNLRDKPFGTARIILRVEPHAIVVPQEAVQSGPAGQFVFVRDKNFLQTGTPKIFYARQVRTGARDDKFVELLAGALPGEVVATQGSPVLLAQLLRSNLGEGCGCHKR
jgi:cobalt-zinc-cadmium efflux system membrane fusion protein